MFRATGYPLIFLAMFSIAGGHWTVLQSVAWAGMLIEYSKNSNLGAAVEKTFSGKAPCKMCVSIEAGKQKESRLPASVKADKKIDKFLSRATESAPPPAAKPFSYAPVSDETASLLPSPPPAPVPIAA